MRMETHRPRPWLGCALFGSLLSPVVVAAPTLSAQIPFDVTVTPPVNLPNLQQDFDDLSWQTFIARNWPALANGTLIPAYRSAIRRPPPVVSWLRILMDK